MGPSQGSSKDREPWGYLGDALQDRQGPYVQGRPQRGGCQPVGAGEDGPGWGGLGGLVVVLGVLGVDCPGWGGLV